MLSRRIVFSLCLLSGLAPAIDAANAQGVCGFRPAVVDDLKAAYQETPNHIGILPNGAVMEVFTSPSGSFTVIVTNPQGVSCVVMSGENWENKDQKSARLKI